MRQMRNGDIFWMEISINGKKWTFFFDCRCIDSMPYLLFGFVAELNLDVFIVFPSLKNQRREAISFYQKNSTNNTSTKSSFHQFIILRILESDTRFIFIHWKDFNQLRNWISKRYNNSNRILILKWLKHSQIHWVVFVLNSFLHCQHHHHLQQIPLHHWMRFQKASAISFSIFIVLDKRENMSQHFGRWKTQSIGHCFWGVVLMWDSIFGCVEKMREERMLHWLICGQKEWLRISKEWKRNKNSFIISFSFIISLIMSRGDLKISKRLNFTMEYLTITEYWEIW